MGNSLTNTGGHTDRTNADELAAASVGKSEDMSPHISGEPATTNVKNTGTKPVDDDDVVS